MLSKYKFWLPPKMGVNKQMKQLWPNITLHMYYYWSLNLTLGTIKGQKNKIKYLLIPLSKSFVPGFFWVLSWPLQVFSLTVSYRKKVAATAPGWPFKILHLALFFELEIKDIFRLQYVCLRSWEEITLMDSSGCFKND